MYLLFELILFSPLIIYACIQVRRLIPSAGVKRLFVSLFIFKFLGYPIAELLSHQRIGAWARYVMIPGYRFIGSQKTGPIAYLYACLAQLEKEIAKLGQM